MTIVSRRMAGIAALILLAVGLAACGDSEPDQRKTFITFLQTRIVSRQGAHVPKPNADENKSFGPYAEHYAVITGFNTEMDRLMQGPYKVAQSNAPRSIQEMLDRRQEIKAMADAMSAMAVEMRKGLADADAKRAALKQPDDLKPVYAAAYERVVTGPGQAFLATVPIAVDGLQASLQLADYLDAHRTAIKVSGSSIQANDAKTRAEVANLLNAMNTQNARLRVAQEGFRAAIEGK
jgi:hypothetical protein